MALHKNYLKMKFNLSEIFISHKWKDIDVWGNKSKFSVTWIIS